MVSKNIDPMQWTVISKSACLEMYSNRKSHIETNVFIFTVFRNVSRRWMKTITLEMPRTA